MTLAERGECILFDVGKHDEQLPELGLIEMCRHNSTKKLCTSLNAMQASPRERCLHD